MKEESILLTLMLSFEHEYVSLKGDSQDLFKWSFEERIWNIYVLPVMDTFQYNLNLKKKKKFNSDRIDHSRV